MTAMTIIRYNLPMMATGMQMPKMSPKLGPLLGVIICPPLTVIDDKATVILLIEFPCWNRLLSWL